jgi:hypothetical protein
MLYPANQPTSIGFYKQGKKKMNTYGPRSEAKLFENSSPVPPPLLSPRAALATSEKMTTRLANNICADFGHWIW